MNSLGPFNIGAWENSSVLFFKTYQARYVEKKINVYAFR